MAWILARYDFYGKSLFSCIIHLPLVLPPVVIGYLLLVLFGKQGVVGSWLWGNFEMGAFGCEHPDRNQLAANGKARAEQILGQHLEGDEILIIGDTHRDIACARSIGAKALAVATGGANLISLEAHYPDLALPDLNAISAAELLRI